MSFYLDDCKTVIAENRNDVFSKLIFTEIL